MEHSAGFGIVNKAEVDVFLELSCFFDNPVDVGILISGSLAFSKSSLNIWTFVGKVMSLLFNMLSGFIIAFLPRSKHLLTSWVQSPPTVISLGSPIFVCLNPQEHVGGFQSPPF